MLGYMQNIIRLRQTIKLHNIRIIHAHYGLSGLLSVLQRRIPVVITFHGSGVNQPKTRSFSKLASRLSAHNIIVEKSFAEKIQLKNKFTLIPCGIDLNRFFIINKSDARAQLGFSLKMKSLYFLLRPLITPLKIILLQRRR